MDNDLSGLVRLLGWPISEGPTVRYFTNHFVDSVLFLFSYEKPAKHVTYVHPRVILGTC